MTSEEKAKRYDEAFEIARNVWRFSSNNAEIMRMEEIFPELRDSEDKNIKEEIKIILANTDFSQFALDYTFADMVTWLEKQCDHANFRNKIQIGDKVTRNEAGILVNMSQLNRIAKPRRAKPVDKVEPKFKVGDWVVKGDTIAQILDIQEQYYVGLDINGKDFTSSRFLNDDKIHLWTIKDAKDGDVLKEDSCTFIIERMKSDGTAIIHCCLFDDGDFDLGSTLGFDVDSTYPATKEQRDLLFAKMRESGYEWDSEKKELLERVIDEGKAEMDYCFTKMMNGEKVSSTWNEEDERILDALVTSLNNEYFARRLETLKGIEILPVINWLKSIKQRIKE